MQEILYKIGETIMNNVTIEMVFKFIIIYFFVIWISLIIWVIKDITIRTNNIFFQKGIRLLCRVPLLFLTLHKAPYKHSRLR